MGKLEEYLERAKDLAGDAGEMAKNIAGDVADRAKEFADERSKVKELAKSAKEQTSTLAMGAKERVQGVLQDAKVSKEIKQGITELEDLPEFDGSILYKMDLEAIINSLSGLLLLVSDNRLDDDSVAEEIRKVMGKVQPAAEPQAEGAAPEQTEEEQAIEKAKTIAYSACTRALEALKGDTK